MAINVFNSSFISFDGGWNAQVAANYAKTGEYATTWPAGAVFNRVITTGQTMLLPTAWIFKLFDISFETIAFIPLCYMIGFIFVLYSFIKKMVAEILECERTNQKEINIQSNVISLLILIVMWSVLKLTLYSFDLCGEGATLFFIAVGLLGINNYKNKEKSLWLILTGIAFVGAIMTKLVSVCFVAVATVILIIYIIQRNRVKDMWNLAGGMIVSFLSMDFIKFQQLKYNLKNYILWWIDYFKYNLELNQSDNHMSLAEKMLCYENAFQLQRYWGLLALGVGICILIFAGLQGVFRKKWCIPIEIFICGLGGVSYILVSIFISKGGALWTRRLIIHFVFFILYLILTCTQFIVELLKQKSEHKEKDFPKLINIIIKVIGIVIIAVSIIPALGSGIRELVSLSAVKREEQELLFEQVSKLSEDARLVTRDWRFSSAMSTLADMEIVHMDEVDFSSNVDYYYISEDYLVQDILDAFNYNIIYQKNEDSLQPCIVQLTGWKSISQ